MGIAENIKHLRTDNNLTQLEFGRIAGVSDKAVSTWEAGIKEPRMGAIKRIAAHFDLSINELVGDSIPSPKIEPHGEARLIKLYRDLNGEGQEKLLDYAEDLSASGRYIKSDTPVLGQKQA